MPDCQATGPFCGDAEINGPETCDDANDDNEDGCTTACAPPTCGDSLIVDPEACDLDNLNGADCLSLGFLDGLLQCTDTCSFDTSACVGCGDGVKSDAELCDGDDLGGEDCVSQGFAGGGTLLCAPACDTFDTSQCIAGECGNDIIEGDEVCDGTDLNGEDCISVDPNIYAAGTLACTDTCSFDTSACVGCGDGVKSDAELCDGDDLGGEDCVSQGFAGGGTLLCAPACDTFDTSQCIAGECGNDIIEGDEVCDGTDLNGEDCISVDPNIYAAGTLACSGACNALDTSDCSSGGCCEINDEDASICTVDAIYNCACDLDFFCCIIWDSTCREIGIDECGAVCP